MNKEARVVKNPLREISSKSLRELAGHLASQFGTEVSLFKDLMAAANALDEGEPEKACRILGVKIQP